MRMFANLFLTLFLMDGIISVTDEVCKLLALGSFFSGVRVLVAGIVLVMAIPIYLSLGIDRRLPKRLFLPLLLLLFWSTVGTWLFPFLAENGIYGLLMSSVQVLLCFFPLAHFDCRGRFGLQLPAELFKAPFFSGRNSLVFAAVNLAVLPVALALIGLSAASTLISAKSAGFVRLTPQGLCMVEKVYQLEDKTIRLMSMIHVGDKEFYSDLLTSSSPGRTIVLAEGVSDDEQMLHNKFGYGKMAGFLGLTSQETVRFPGRLINEDDIVATGFKPGVTGKPDILRADVDISSFKPETRTFLDQVGKLLADSSSFLQAMRTINAWAEKNITPEAGQSIIDDILHRRNVVVIRHLCQVLPRYDLVIIPWGALHMAEIEESVLKRGFVLQQEQSRLSIDFMKLISRTTQ